MRKHLTEFTTELLYTKYLNSSKFETPNVSVIRSLGNIIYTKAQTGLLVNGAVHTEKVITLPAGGTYELIGTHHGQIIIDARDMPSTWTTIKLNGVTILSDEAYGILYDCPQSSNAGYQGLQVNLVKDTHNFIICNKETPIEGDETYASIDSWKDLSVLGVGYLAVYNNIGHGLRGEKLTIGGPHIYTDTVHDGIHGNTINVLDGKFYFRNAKDAFGTTENGKINVFDGEFEFINVTQDTFDSKKTGLYVPEIITGTNFVGIESLYEAGTVTAYPSSADYKAGTNGVVITPVIADIKAGTYYNADSNGNVVASSTPAGDMIFVYDDPEEQIFNGMAYIIGKEYFVIEVTGKINYPIIRPLDAISIDTPKFSKKGKLNGGYDNDFDVYLNGATIITELDSPSILNLPDAGRIKVVAVKDTINAVINKTTTGVHDLDAVKSENNLSIEAKNDSVLYITSAGGDGIDGGDTKITDSKGSIIINNCAERGIKGTYIVIGPNAEIPNGIINPYINSADTANYTTFNGALIVKNNVKSKTVGLATATVEDPEMKQSGFADIYGRNGKHSKGKILITNNELKGVVITGSIGARDSIDLDSADNLYVKQFLLYPINPVSLTTEEYYAVPYEGEPIL